MRYGETGYDLEIDLSTGNIEKVERDPKLTELYLGGLGLNAYTMWSRVPADIDPFDPDNLLIFAAGLLDGTMAHGANRTIVTSYSPQTKLLGFSMMGGFWAPELKYAGYDRIIIKGKAPELVYLWIENDKVEIRDAKHLKGKGTYETAYLIREEMKDSKVQVMAIGLAGENRVFFASLEHGRNSASRLGLGAVMGSKNLKAIAVRGTKDVPQAKPERMKELYFELLRYIQYRLQNPLPGIPGILAYIGSPQEMKLFDERWHTTSFAWGHARYRRKDFWTEEIEKKWAETQRSRIERYVSCYNCPVECGAIIRHEGLTTHRYLMKCFTKLTYLMAAESDSLEFNFDIAGKAQEYGLDGFTTPQVMAFAVELYENGILTNEDLPGFPKNNEERFYYLLEKIVRREGIGDILADGVYWAARRIGKGAEKFDHNTTKKHEQMVIKLGMLNPIYFLMYATGEKGNITQIEGQIPQAPLPKEVREEFVKDWPHVPKGKEERFKRFILEWGDEGKVFPFYPPPDLCCELVEWQEIMHYIDDCTGVCAGLSSFPIKPPYHIHNYPEIISAAAGLDIDEDELWTTATRVRTLVRAINVRRGMRRKDEKPPEDHWKKRFPEYEEKLLDTYYKYRGWNKEGIPTIKTLKKLKLDYVAEDFIKRGILKPEEEEE